jgi:hypothetical protein
MLKAIDKIETINFTNGTAFFNLATVHQLEREET